MNRLEIFQKIYDDKVWMVPGQSEVESGSASNIENTRVFRDALNTFLRDHRIKTILDIGSGPIHWQKHLDLTDIRYIGIDIIPIKTDFEFYQHDIVSNPINFEADLIIMRKFLQHQTNEEIKLILQNLEKMRFKFVILDLQDVDENQDIDPLDTSRFRPVDLRKAPFNLPNPATIFNDHAGRLGVWLKADFEKKDFFTIDVRIKDPTVLMAILTEEKDYVLDLYLRRIEAQTYLKNNIVIYIKSNHKTKHILSAWAQRNAPLYKKIIIDDSDILSENNIMLQPEEASFKFRLRAAIRQKSLNVCLAEQCHYYFIAECDNFIEPETLKYLVEQRKPIIAPLLRAFPNENDPYSNYFSDIDYNGFYKNHSSYYDILKRKKTGLFRVPVVHATYLIDSKYIPRLYYDDSINTFEFIHLTKKARRWAIEQYISNELNFGVLLHYNKEMTEEELIEKINLL